MKFKIHASGTMRVLIPAEGLSLLRNYAGTAGRGYARRGSKNMQIGTPIRTIVVEPLELPVQEPKIEPEPSHEAEPQPEEAPVAQ
jgi:hypothetical protein